MINICKNCNKEFEFPIPKSYCLGEECLKSRATVVTHKEVNCPHCLRTVEIRLSGKTCPACKRYIEYTNEEKVILKCLKPKCGSSWIQRKKEGRVKQCPSCKSLTWDIPEGMKIDKQNYFVTMKIPVAFVEQVKGIIEGKEIKEEKITETINNNELRQNEYEELTMEEALKMLENL